jgi:hypothetical protein
VTVASMEQMTSSVVKQMVSPSINYKGSVERKRSFGHPSLRCMSTLSLNRYVQYVSFIDEFSHKTCICFLEAKGKSI